MRYRCASFVISVLALLPAAAGAQAPDVIAPRATSSTQQLSANPFGLMFKWFNAEYEHRGTAASTWGLSASYFGPWDTSYRNAAAFWRYYPSGHALHGFYVGGRFGVHNVSFEGASDVFLGAGFEMGYNWVLGAHDNFLVGTGAGATRLFGGSLSGASLTLPTLRLVNIGYAF